MDSEIESGYDVGYNADDCTVIYNDRLSNDNESISRLLIDCNDFELDSDFTVESAMITAFVDHFSAALIQIHSASSSYYPGESMLFSYTVTDRVGNVIDGGVAPNTTITLSSNAFVGLLWIDADGYCQICEEGVWLSDISIEGGDVGDEYTLEMATDNNQLVLGQNEVTFNVTGCPLGFGADSDNFTCTVCDAFTYNIESDFVGECSSCDPDDNEGLVVCEM